MVNMQVLQCNTAYLWPPIAHIQAFGTQNLKQLIIINNNS